MAAATSWRYVPRSFVPSIKLDLSSFSFVELKKVEVRRISLGWGTRQGLTHWAPSSPLPIGSSNTFTPRVSAKVRVTGIEPPSRVMSGVLL